MGKPEQPTVALVHQRLGTTGVMVGDRPSTDGAMADALGWPFALVLSGVTAAVGAAGGEAIPLASASLRRRRPSASSHPGSWLP